VSYGLGLDLGATYVAAAVSHGGRVEMFALGDRTVVTPAVVFAREDGSILTGEAANRRALNSPERIARGFKRRLGDPNPVLLGGSQHAVTSLLAALLSEAVSRVTLAEGAAPERVILTHPATWGPYRRELFEEVPQLAGIGHVLMVTEPQAAAAHYAVARRLNDGETVAVYDLGGEAFGATVLRTRAAGIDILGTPEGIERLGGDDFDEAILAYINLSSGGALSELDLENPQTGVALARLRHDCTLAKEALSIDTEATIPVFLPNRYFDVRLTRTEFEDMIRASVKSTIGALIRTLRSAQVEPGELGAVLLVGGSSRIPLVARMITEAVHRPTLVDAHPKYAVALGAAVLGPVSAGYRGNQITFPPLPPAPEDGAGVGGSGRAGEVEPVSERETTPLPSGWKPVQPNPPSPVGKQAPGGRGPGGLFGPRPTASTPPGWPASAVGATPAGADHPPGGSAAPHRTVQPGQARKPDRDRLILVIAAAVVALLLIATSVIYLLLQI
jgi:molecular chaperone DnaK (HSP70)